MTTKDEALRLALEALRQDRAWLESDAPEEIWTLNNDALAAVISAYHEALAQPAGERGAEPSQAASDAYDRIDHFLRSKLDDHDYTHYSFDLDLVWGAALLSSDAQPSEWVGLGDEEVQVMAFRAVKAHPEWRHLNCTVPVGAEAAPFVAELYRAIEAKLREKNARKDMPAAADTRKQDRWDDVPQDFRDWWNGDYDDSTNPFRLNSSAYWAWAGWKAAEDKAGGDEPVAIVVHAPTAAGFPDGETFKVLWLRSPSSFPHGTKLYPRPQPQAQAMRDALTVGIGITRIDPRDIYSDPKEKNSG